MPLHGNKKRVIEIGFERFDDAVVCPRDRAQLGATLRTA